MNMHKGRRKYGRGDGTEGGYYGERPPKVSVYWLTELAIRFVGLSAVARRCNTDLSMGCGFKT